jgi:hypothetical protein
MAPTNILERVPLNEVSKDLPGAGYSLNITFVYQDTPTRQWAREVYDRVAKLAGTESARATWWKIDDLSEPGVLAGAVSTAMRADVIVIAVRMGEGLPLPFYVWVNGWLPHRSLQTGALVALLENSGQRSQKSGRVREYLAMVAQQGRLDFLPEERVLFVEEASTSMPARQQKRRVIEGQGNDGGRLAPNSLFRASPSRKGGD